MRTISNVFIEIDPSDLLVALSFKMQTHTTVKYPSIDNVNLNSTRSWKGTGAEENNHRWYIEEKVDGSQMSFVVSAEEEPTVTFYNKGSPINPTNKVFVKAINMITMLASKLNPAYVYHGEAVCSSRHNVVQYDRYPKYYFILFDIQGASCGELKTPQGPTGLLNPDEKRVEAERIGLEVVPTFIWNTDPDRSPYVACKELLDDIMAGKVQSILGGRPEGVVLKHHNFVSKGKSVATKLKLVTPEFKESHGMKQIKGERHTPELAVAEVGKSFSTPARFQKAVQHLRDADKLKNSPEDLYKLKEELDADLERENQEEIMMYLWAELAPYVKRECRTNFDEWYKEYLDKHNPHTDSSTETSIAEDKPKAMI